MRHRDRRWTSLREELGAKVEYKIEHGGGASSSERFSQPDLMDEELPRAARIRDGAGEDIRRQYVHNFTS